MGRHRGRFIHILLPLALAVLVTLTVSARAQVAPEEIVIGMDIPRLLQTDLFVQYDGRTVYLPIIEVFRLLDFNITADLSQRSYAGFLYNRSARFDLDLATMQATVGKSKYPLTPGDFILGQDDLFLRLDLYALFFDLKMDFDFSRMRVVLPLSKEFPAYQKMVRKVAHEKLKAEEAALKDVEKLSFRRTYLGGGVADWMLSANPIGGGQTQYFNLNLGGMLLGGDVTVSGGGDTKVGVDTRQMNYVWHYSFDDNPYLTQAEVGDVFAGGAISRSLNGVMVTNQPQVHRTYFQTIHLSENIGRGWEVELYVDNRLVDFTQTDESGTYNFDVDIFYGASLVTVKMYGPNGEIQTQNSHVRIPYNLIPKGTVEYTLAAGRTNGYEEKKSYTQAHLYYGVTPRLTVGVSSDVPLQASATEGTIVVGEATIQPLQNLTVSGYVAPNHALNGAVNFSRPSLLNFSGQITRYYSNRLSNRPDTLLQSIVLSASAPISFGKRVLGLRAYLSIDKTRRLTTVNTNYGLSTGIGRFHFNYLGSYKPATTERGLTSQLLASAGIVSWVRPQVRVDYDHQTNRLMKYGLYITKRLFRTGQLTASYERNEMSRADLFMVTFNLLSSFADFTSRVVGSSHQIGVTQTQRGSVRYDQATRTVHFSHRGGVGFGSALLRPFKDSNFNGVYDANEEYIPGLKAKVRGSTGQMVGASRTIYYDRLRPYDEYVVQIDPYSLDNPLLKPAHEGYKVAFNPNMVTAIDVPVVVAGEISGRVVRRNIIGESGLGGIKIEIMNTTTESITEITTFNNGDYYYLGLVPGQYRAYVKREQLAAHGLVSEPPVIEFEMKASETGGVVANINFILVPQK